MVTFFLSFAIFTCVAAALALGLAFRRRPACSGCAAAARIDDGEIRSTLCEGCDRRKPSRGSKR